MAAAGLAARKLWRAGRDPERPTFLQLFKIDLERLVELAASKTLAIRIETAMQPFEYRSVH